MDMPAMRSMLSQLSIESSSAEGGERFIAEQLTYIWRRFEYLKHDPRVIELINDRELQSSLRQENPVMLMTNVKFQRLAALIMEGSSQIEDSELNELLLNANPQPAGTALPDQSAVDEGIGAPVAEEMLKEAVRVVKPYVPQTVYKWVDDNGRRQYSDWEQVPADKRADAEPLVR